MANAIVVGKASQVPPGKMKSFSAGDKRVLVANVGGTLFATQDLCTHDNGTLADGELMGEEIECPRHGARFDVRTGQVRALPAMFPIKTFPVKVENDEIRITFD